MAYLLKFFPCIGKCSPLMLVRIIDRIGCPPISVNIRGYDSFEMTDSKTRRKKEEVEAPGCLPDLCIGMSLCRPVLMSCFAR